MRKLIFKPMLGLSLVLVICVAILIGLGLWQYQRLQWKTALLAEVEASVTAPPLKSLEALNEVIKQKGPIDFRRIEFFGAPILGGEIYHLYSSKTGGIYWDVIEPVSSEPYNIFVKTRMINDAEKGGAESIVSENKPQKYTGYVRKTYPMGKVESWVKPKANSETNRYFYFDQNTDWFDALPQPNFEGFYIEAVQNAASADDLAVRRPEIANNHFDYMLTWWSFALIFIVIYLILHKRAGRLRFQ